MAPPPQGPPATNAQRSLGDPQQRFLQQLTPDALQVSQATGIPYQLLLAIPANETGWGTAVAGNNYFGIKGSNPKTGANTGQVGTWEVVNGQRQDIQDTFRAYGSPAESMQDFADLINTTPRYSNVKGWLAQHPGDWRGAARLLLSDGYATDPAWADKIINLGGQVDQGPQAGPLKPSEGIKSVLDVGSSAIGQRYQFGGAGGRGQSALTSPTDCSGFVAWAYEQATGIRLPAQTQGIYANTLAISPNQAMPGDLVMYNMGQGPNLEHVGIYAGGNMMLHDSSLNPNGGVELTPLWSGAEFRRVPGVDPSLVSRPNTDPLGRSQGQGQVDEQVSDWAIVNLGGQQTWLGTTQSGRVIRQTLSPAPQGTPEGKVIDASFLQRAPQTPPVPDAGGGNEVGAGAEATPNPTMAKHEAGYTRKASEDHCQDCSMFRSNACTLVKGYIHAKGSCDYFEPKKMGSGQDEGDDSALPYYSGYTDPQGNVVPLPPPSPQVVSRAADLGWLGPENAPEAQGQRAADAQYSIDQANIQNEAQFLSRQQTPPVQAPPPAALTATGDEANAAIGRFDLTLPPDRAQPQTRQPIRAPTAPPSTIPPRRPIAAPTATAPAPSPDSGETPTPAAPPQGGPVQVLPQKGDLLLRAGQGVAQKGHDLYQFLAKPETQEAIHTAGTVVGDIANPTNMLPGIAASVDYARQNGIDFQAPLDKLMKVEPGSALDRVVKAGVAGNPADPVDMVAGMVEYQGKLNDYRADLVRAAQPPELRGTPEGEAAAQGIALVTDPMNMFGAPEVSAGRKLITEGGELATPAMEKALPGMVRGLTSAGSPEFHAAEAALGRPWTAQESARILQQASLDLSTHAETLAMQNSARALTTGGKFEPLSGDALRRTVISAVARENPGAQPTTVLKLADGILSRAGAESLTTDAIVHPAPAALRTATVESLTNLGYPMLAGMTQPEVDKLLFKDPTALIARLEEYARRAVVAKQPARAGVSQAIGMAAGGLAGVSAADRFVDPNDPNRQLKLAGAGAAGVVGGLVAVPWAAGMLAKGVDKTVLSTARRWLAPTEGLTPEMRDIWREWAGNYTVGAMGSQRLADKMRAAFGKGADLRLADWIERTGNLPPWYQKNVNAQQFLKDWQGITAWAVKHDIVPNDINFTKPGSRAKIYVPHVKTEQMQEAIQLGQDATRPRPGRTASNPFDYYNEPRTYELLRDGMRSADYGKTWTYDDDVPRTWGNYYGAAVKRAANKMLVEKMLDVGKRNNPALFATPAGARMALKGEDIVEAPAGMGANMIDGVPISRFIHDPSLLGRNIWVSRDLANVYKNMFESTSFVDDLGSLGNVLDFNAQFKHNVLSGSAFHLINEVRQMMVTQGAYMPKNLGTMFKDMTTPGGARNFWNAHSREASQAIRDGLNLNMLVDRPGHGVGPQLAQTFLNTVVGAALGYQTGTSDQERMDRAKAGAAMGVATSLPIIPGRMGMSSLVQSFSHAMWDRWIPFMKFTTYQMYAPKYGGRAAAEFANEVYGGQNLMAIGRSRSVQDALRFTMLAPDWQEGWARQIGNAVFDWQGPLGEMNRTYWRNAALQSVFVLETMNQVFGGKWSWENDPDAWGLVNMGRFYDQQGWDHRDPTTGQPYTPYLDILGPYRAMLEPMRETARYATAATASALGIDPTSVPFHREIYGDFGSIPEPDPARAWGTFVGSRVGLIPSTIHNFTSGTDWAGRPVDQAGDTTLQVAANRITQAAQHLIPTGEQSILASASRGDPLAMAIPSALTGMRITHRSATNRYFSMQDQFVKDLGESPENWQTTVRNAHDTNAQIDKKIEEIQADPTLTPRERTAQIKTQRDARVSTHKLLQGLIDSRPDLSVEDRAKYASQLRWLDNQTVVAGTLSDADLSGRPDLNTDELMRLAWNRDPQELARIKAGGNPDPNDFAEWAKQGIDQWLLRPSPGKDATQQISSLRARWTQETAALWGIDPAVMDDIVKAQLYQVPGGKPPALPGVKSGQLDDIVNGYENAGNDAKDDQAALLAKQDYLFETAAQLGVDEQALAQRVKLRTLPMADQSPAALQRSQALDVLSASKAYPYTNPDGTPMGSPQEWRDWDTKLKVNSDKLYRGIYVDKAGNPIDELNHLKAGKDEATANRYKTVLGSPNREAFYRWYGDGANLTDDQYQQYTSGTLPMWKDNPDPTEAKNRVAAMRWGQAHTRQQIYDSTLPITWTGDDGYGRMVRHPNDTMASYLRYISRNKVDKYLNLGFYLDE